MTAILGSIQIARKTKTAWTLQNPVLLAGQVAAELDAGKIRFKVGDAVTAYNSLPYASVSDADIEAYVDPLYYKKSVVDGMFADAVKAPVAINCSSNPNYPAASKGTSYKVSVAGKIGGSSGVNVDVGDLMIASVTTAGGTQAAVGANWGIYETNIDKSSETIFGTARRATTAELTAGSDDEAYVTAAKLRVAADARYLKLSGGVLTGDLTGTSATFSGNVGVGIAPTQALQVNGKIFASSNNAEIRLQDWGSAANWWRFYASTNLNISNNLIGDAASINQNTGAYTALSDRNKKKNFETYTGGLANILTLKPTLYNMKSQDDGDVKELGFVAQDVKDIIPQAYTEAGDFIGLNYSAFTPVIVNAIKELKSEIDNLKAKLAAHNIN